tara:strand:+ start:88 stop:741 length:654 start_codon:yes stop_codon:yes gene_type:complete
MKLVTELVEHVDVRVQIDEETKQKSHFIEGVFLQSELKNRNGRMYPASTMAKEVARYNNEYISKNRAYGELGHPNGPTINLERVSHMIKGLHQEGNNWIGKAKVLDTPYGNIVKNLIDEGAQLGVSSRGMGTLRQKADCQVVQDDFMLSTAADIVADPSAPQAFVNGVMEGVDWVYDAATGHFTQQVIEQTKELGDKDVKKLQENALKLFDKFLKSL